MILRPYQNSDRAAVRRLCFETGDLGQSAKSFFEDSELFADLWTSYYTDIEPESSWVVDENGEVIGYLNACTNEFKFKSFMLFYLIPKALVSAILNQTIFKAYIWQIFIPSLKLWLTEKRIRFSPKRNIDCHLHINLKSGYRGQNLGGQLFEKFYSRAKLLDRRGVSVDVRADNSSALKFFEKLGFHRIEEGPGFYIPELKNPVIRSILLARLF